MRFIILISLALFFRTSPVFGKGFLVYHHDASAAGGGLAFTAQANNPSAVFYNPAGINQLKGTNISAGGTIIIPRTTFTSATTGEKTEMDHHTYFLPNFFVTHKINDKFSAGFGVFCPFGLSTDWPDDWEGRFISTFAEIRTLFLNPVISWQVHPKLSLAAGFNYVFSDVELKNAINLSEKASELLDFPVELPGDPEGRSRLKACGHGQGFNLGLLSHITDDITLGISYRSPIDIDYEGDAEFGIPSNVTLPPELGEGSLDPILASTFQNDGVSTEIDLPHILAIGLATTAIKDWTFEFDLIWIGWSSFDKLNIKFKKGTPPDETIPANWRDSYLYCLGAKYQVNESLALRGGYVYDDSPIPGETLGPMLPDADSHFLTLGVGYRKGHFNADLGYTAVFSEDRSTYRHYKGFNGEYETFISLISLNLQYVF